jgi:phage tail sheath protein FI
MKPPETTMTQNDIRDGPLICVIGMAPVTPAAFVIFQDQPAHGKGRAHV